MDSRLYLHTVRASDSDRGHQRGEVRRRSCDVRLLRECGGPLQVGVEKSKREGAREDPRDWRHWLDGVCISRRDADARPPAGDFSAVLRSGDGGRVEPGISRGSAGAPRVGPDVPRPTADQCHHVLWPHPLAPARDRTENVDGRLYLLAADPAARALEMGGRGRTLRFVKHMEWTLMAGSRLAGGTGRGRDEEARQGLRAARLRRRRSRLPAGAGRPRRSQPQGDAAGLAADGGLPERTPGGNAKTWRRRARIG